MRTWFLVLLAGMGVGLAAGPAGAADVDYHCVPLEVAALADDVRIECARLVPNFWAESYPRDPAAPDAQIRYFAVSLSQDMADRLGRMAEVAIAGGLVMRFTYPAGSVTGQSATCPAANCRRPTHFALHRTAFIPGVRLPAPQQGLGIVAYAPEGLPKKSSVLSFAKPIGVQQDTDADVFRVRLWLPAFDGPVDIYLGWQIPNNPEVYLLTPTGGVQAVSAGLVPWRTGITHPIDVNLTGDNVKLSGLAKGEYRIYVGVTPAGSTAGFVIWDGSFQVP